MRVSLNRRLDRVLDRLLPPGSTERILHDLPDDTKATYAQWRARCDAVAARYAGKPGAFYEALLEGMASPPVPPSIAHLFPRPPAIKTEMTSEQAADIYQATFK